MMQPQWVYTSSEGVGTVIKQYLAINIQDADCLKYIQTPLKQYLQDNVVGEDPVLVEIALHEALNNAVFHGPEQGKVTLRLCVQNDKRIVIRVKNEGDGFTVARLDCLKHYEPTAEALAEDCGRGLFMMNQIMDRVVYNKRGTEVLMTKSFDLQERHA